MTATFAEAAVRTRRYPPLRHLSDGIVRGALLLDLAAARLVTADGDGLHASASGTGFAPADRLLDIIATAGSAGLPELIWHAPVGMDHVIREFVSRGWWARVPGSRWRRPRRYLPTDLISASTRDPEADELVELMMLLFDGAIDTDDIEAEVAAGEFGAATWLAHPVLHELIELRSWLHAASTTHQSTA